MARVVVTEPGTDPAVRAALEGAGHEVWEARNGAAPGPGPGTSPDLLLCDLCVPGVDGAAALRAARQRFPGLLVVALVAGAFDEPANLARFARALGVSHVVPKPFRAEALLGAVEGATCRD
jgi:CheY-like chemotaxis protein